MAIGRRPADSIGADRGLERVRPHRERARRPGSGRGRRGRGRASCTPSRSSCAPRSRRRRASDGTSGRPASPRAATSRPAASRAAASAISDEVDAVSVSSPSNAVRQPEPLAQPVDDDLLELGADRRRPPQHRVLAERRGQHLAEDARARRGRREVGHEARVLPVGRVGGHQPVVVGEDRVERLRLSRAARLGNAGRSEPGSIGGKTARSSTARGSRPSGRPPGGRPPGRRRRPCRPGHRLGRRRGRTWTWSDGLPDLGQDRAHLRSEEDEGDDAQQGDQQEDQEDHDTADREAIAGVDRTDDGRVGQSIMEALLRRAGGRRDEQDQRPEEIQAAGAGQSGDEPRSAR